MNGGLLDEIVTLTLLGFFPQLI